MPIWLALIIAAMPIINSWLLKWVDLDSKTPASEKSKSKSKVYITKYKTGIVIVAFLVSISTLAYLVLSSVPINKVSVLLISLNVCAIFIAVLAWIFMVNNQRIRKLIEEAKGDAQMFALMFN